MVGSLDVCTLYPSLDQEGSARAVARFVQNTPTVINGIDWRQAQVFVASSMDQHELEREGFAGIVPKRLNRRGRIPGMMTKDLWTKR